MPLRILAALTLVTALSSPALARPHHHTCVEVRDPGVGSYRICAPAPRRR